jgi:prepilin-type N-terminal cleavage/methylation domain-containing protein
MKSTFLTQKTIQHHSKNRAFSSGAGFTLVETLVAISILLVAVTFPMIFINTSSRSVSTAKEQVLATFLAQEGVELVHAVRDHDRLRNLNGELVDDFETIDTCLDTTCTVDPMEPPPTRLDVCSGGCEPLLFDGQVYIQDASNSGGEPSERSKFTRSVYIEDGIDGVSLGENERLVRVEVRWVDRSGSTRTVSAQEHLFRFQQTSLTGS